MDYYSPENWEINKDSTLSSEVLEAIEHYLNYKGFIAVLHWHFCGGRSPSPSAYEDFGDFKEYLDHEAKPGDIIHILPFPEGEGIFSGKVPNENGQIPKKGAY